MKETRKANTLIKYSLLTRKKKPSSFERFAASHVRHLQFWAFIGKSSLK